jgi:hypothetical protein
VSTGVLDYVIGSALLAAPELFRLKDVPPAALTPRLAGAGATTYSLMTDYELGAVRLLSMPVHLALDAMSGVLLLSSPHLGCLAMPRTACATGYLIRSWGQVKYSPPWPPRLNHLEGEQCQG